MEDKRTTEQKRKNDSAPFFVFFCLFLFSSLRLSNFCVFRRSSGQLVNSPSSTNRANNLQRFTCRCSLPFHGTSMSYLEPEELFRGRVLFKGELSSELVQGASGGRKKNGSCGVFPRFVSNRHPVPVSRYISPRTPG